MAGKSPIEWTEQTWNPIIGCSIKSPGCKHCYAMPMAARIEAMNAGNIAKGKPPGAPHYDGTTKLVNGKAVFTGKIAMAPDSILLQPLKRKKPTTYFVNSMGDLFHEDCPDEWIDRVFAVMALSPQHTFQVLTKRAERMRDYLASWPMNGEPDRITEIACDIAHSFGRGLQGNAGLVARPLPNVWLGVSTERQQELDDRWPYLRDTPAAVRFISYEPALGPLDITITTMCRGDQVLNWLISGGESGANARPMNPQWARDVRDQCKRFGVAFFHKQNGEYVSVSEVEGPGEHFHFADGRTVRRVGKKAAGRHLDGVLHDAMPQADGRGRG